MGIVPDISDDAVRDATGRDWDSWVVFLDGLGAEDRSHKSIVALVRDNGGVESAWWQQAVANGYEKLKGKRETGETLETGFQIGVRRTLDVPPDEAWRRVTSPGGMATWLGPGEPPDLTEAATYALDDGSHGEVRVVKEGRRLRLTWHPDGWPRPSTVQVTVAPGGDGRSVVAFHQEHIPGPDEREERRSWYVRAAEAIRDGET